MSEETAAREECLISKSLPTTVPGCGRCCRHFRRPPTHPPPPPAPAAASRPATLEDQLLEAARAADVVRVYSLLEQGADPGHQDEEGGVSLLMAAAEAGSAEAVGLLLAAGAPWQAQDKEGYTAGDYASGSRHSAILRQLLDWAVVSCAHACWR